MTNINYEATDSTTYESIARENGFVVDGAEECGWYWHQETNKQVVQCYGWYNTPEGAWKACCVENGLIEGE